MYNHILAKNVSWNAELERHEVENARRVKERRRGWMLPFWRVVPPRNFSCHLHDTYLLWWVVMYNTKGKMPTKFNHYHTTFMNPKEKTKNIKQTKNRKTKKNLQKNKTKKIRIPWPLSSGYILNIHHTDCSSDYVRWKTSERRGVKLQGQDSKCFKGS